MDFRATSSMLTQAVPGTVRLGPVRVPVFGTVAAGGMVVAMLLSQPAARRARVSAQATWDAGLFAVLASFVASRMLLAVSNPGAFQRYPLLVLAFPSFTWLGLALALLLTLVQLVRRGEPVLRILDAWSVPATLLAAVLALGRWVEGSSAGMPWRDRGPGPAIPVQGMAIAGWLVLAALLWRLLGSGRPAGFVAALALTAGGLMSFGLQQVTQPAVIFGDGWLEPGEWMALAAMLLGGTMLVFLPELERFRWAWPSGSAGREEFRAGEAR